MAEDVIRGREPLHSLFKDGRIVLEPQADGTYVARSSLLPFVLLATKAQTPESEDSRVRSTELQSVHLVARGSNAQLCALVEVAFEWRVAA